MKRSAAASAAVLLSVLLAGCGSHKYTHYRSVFKDWSATLPYGWNVYTDAQGKDFAETRFIGSFDGDALFGLPSISVKWFRNFHGHILRDDSVESYDNADDYITQTLEDVYHYRYGDTMSFLVSPVPDENGDYTQTLDYPKDIPQVETAVGKLPMKMFVVRSPVRVSPKIQWGVEIGPDGKTYNQRVHAYAVISLPDGFYVLSYPATRHSFPHHIADFVRLVNTFHVLTDGPDGAKVLLRAD
jgi:hypothetical protein